MYSDLADRIPVHFVTAMEEYKARGAVLSDYIGDGDDYHYGSHGDDCNGYSDCDDPNNYDECQDCHLSIHDFDEPDNYMSSIMTFMALMAVVNIVSLMVMPTLMCHPWRNIGGVM